MRSWVEVSLGRIRANFRAVRNLVGAGVEVMPVVKADAYRHGAIEVSRALVSEGAHWLAVSNVDEGIALRDAGIRARILVMADYLPEDREALSAFHLTPVIHSLEDVTAVRVPYHLKIDSGMGRLGTRAPAEEIVRVVLAARAAGSGELEGVMTHFASSGNYDSPQTAEQVARFEAILAALREAGIVPRYVHSSATIPVAYKRTEAWGNLVRPGHAIYGYISPARGTRPPKGVLDVAPALTWKASVLAVKEIEAGALVGYGGIHRTTKPTRIAVLAAGYADGIPHRLGNKGQVIAQGKLAPIIGAVSMDLTTIDASDCPDLRPGDAVKLLGSEGDGANRVSIDAQQMARWAGTISYAVLCGIHARVKRLYVD
ncbi:MAG: alanine racemase [Bryobacteraceae bacterium]